MNKITLLNTKNLSKGKILRTLRAFAKRNTGNFEERSIRKYKYAKRLAKYNKSDLETSKADIEFYIDRQRTDAAFYAVLGIIVARIFAPSPFLEFVVVVSFAIVSALIFVDVEKKVFWLHIIKIAINRKSEQLTA